MSFAGSHRDAEGAAGTAGRSAGRTSGPRRIGTYKTYANPLARLDLPEPTREAGVGIWSALNERSSIRDYTQEPLSLSELSQLLWASQGITREQGEWQFRTAPSAGALYPVETYLGVNRVGGLTAGLYHYEIRYHRLAFLREDPLIGIAMTRAALGQTLCQRAAVVFLWSAVIARSARKYGERAYRYIYMDSGHVAQNVYLASTALGLGCCAIGAFFDDEVNAVLDVDGREETAIYMASIGRRG